MPYKYAYITGCLILSIIWIYIFSKRKDLRREMIFASCWGAPFGFVDFFLVPTYWHPDSLFGLMKNYSVGIESFIFLFLMAGIVSVVYEFFWRERLVKLGHAGRHHYWILFVIPMVFLLSNILFPTNAIYNLMIVGAAGAIIIALLRKDLIGKIFFSSFVFSLLYLGVFVLVNLIFPDFIKNFYNIENTWGILIVGIPLEEIAVAFFAGAFWSTIYEYTKCYRDKCVV